MKVLVSLLIAVGCLLVAPVAASAATYTVDSIGDQPDETIGSNGCKTSVNTCTLRAAIAESNFDAVADTIKFNPSFNGQVADTIALGSSLPAIEFPLTIDGDAEGTGGQCATEAGVKGPCAGVDGPAGAAALIVEDANSVAIEGLALTGALGGGSAVIDVIDGSEEFKAADNWLGIKLDGTSAGNTKGIYLDPGSDKAVIGGVNAAERNVIANSVNEGFDIEGASDAVIQGNYFGVKPDGVTAAANGKNVEITDANSFEATGNEIGATIEGAALATPACDGGCNVIGGTGLTTGIDLDGEEDGNEAPASGPTTVHGNFVGLDAPGTSVVANGIFDVLAGAADQVTIGGPEAGDANYIAGGGYGIYHENGESFEALGNVIGATAGEAPATPPSTVGIFVYTLGIANGPTVAGNFVRMVGGIGIEQRFGATGIFENIIEGGTTGIFTLGDGASGNVIEGNAIEGAEANGILIENDLNEVLGNGIFESGAAGVRVQNPAALVITTGNLIGGDAPGDENAIAENGGDAIEIVDTSGSTEEDSENEVARNRGGLNGGSFIDLVGNPNGGILPPAFATATQAGASGSGAEAGATIRVFRKASAEAGEIKSFLAEAVADGSGNWKVTYPASIPGATIVAATQTSVEGGTSELSTATTAADPDNNGGGKGPEACPLASNLGCGGQAPPHPKPIRVPSTKIEKGPKAKTHDTAVKFKFSSDVKGSKFECKLDRKPFKPCKSPKTYKKLKPGNHVFKVRAVNGKNVDPTPAKRKFKILD